MDTMLKMQGFADDLESRLQCIVVAGDMFLAVRRAVAGA
jgi:hypothetical protein